MKSIKKLTIIALLGAILLVGCAQQANTPETSAGQTAIANTVVAMQTQISDTKATAAAATEPATVEPTAEPTATALPTIELVPTATEAATVETTLTIPVSSGTPFGPSYRVGHVTDLNYPDGTYFNQGMFFTKQWSISNVGTGTWTEDYKIVFVKGDDVDAPVSIPLGRVLSPGQSMTISVDLHAPVEVGTYSAYFMLQTPDGKNFGIGPNFDEPFWIKFYVR
ncbi:MAG: NBR1-Ig-like domain-containing protein [Anaerolineaceae bacterium]|nr:NBR1-Ig-like domain-containing protein [Anaerolineaceae bacterium]